MNDIRAPILVSACAAGVTCRYNGKAAFSPEVIELMKKHEVILVCPEILAGQPIPRPACQITGGNGDDVLKGTARVKYEVGRDYTDLFIKGAKKVLEIALRNGVKTAYLHDKSPSCGAGRIYNGKTVKSGYGVLSALLRENNIDVIAI